MNYFIAIFIFCVVLFLYLHIYYHLKTSNDLEVYTIERPSKNKLEEICDLRQPVVFEFSNERLLESCNLASLDDNYGAFDIKLRDTQQNDEHSLYDHPSRIRHRSYHLISFHIIFSNNQI